jgi:DNA polymerase-1
VTKLKSTYVDALPQLINKETGCIHTTFQQAIAATGRLSSTNPNLQNIPIRTELGREIRRAFVPRSEEFTIFSADYSQVELRLVAAISKDESMIQAFSEGKDIHRSTAAKVFGVSEDDVSADMRRQAKTVNFGIIYGISAFGLSERLEISRSDAKEIIDSYFEKFPGIRNYMDDTIDFARKHGYVKTLFNRKRKLRDINSANHTQRSFAERNAINSPIQGTAADIIKLAMINIHEKMKKNSFNSKMVLQVHDELVFDAHLDELDDLNNLVTEEMQNVCELSVPLLVETGSGANWLEAH